MTKYVEIMNADVGTSFVPVVQVWDKGYSKQEDGSWIENGEDILVEEFPLLGPFDRQRRYITQSRYIVIKELNHE